MNQVAKYEKGSPVEQIKRTPPEKKTGGRNLPQIFTQLLLAAAIIGGGIIIASYYLKTPPKAKPRIKKAKIPLVQITQAKRESPDYTTQAMGTVVESTVIFLSPLVGGELIKINPHFTPGGFFSEKEPLATINPIDFELSLIQLQNEAAKAQSALTLEMGNQKIALKEFEILDQEVHPEEKSLMLRQPQLQTAKANLGIIEAKVKQAQLNLARTTIKAPFNGIVLSKNVHLGSKVTSNSSIAKIAGTDEFWIQFTLPARDLCWLTIPEDGSSIGSAVRVYLSGRNRTNSYRTGYISRLDASVEQGSKMAVLYATVQDPLCLREENRDKPKLLLGSFVRMNITGKQLQDVLVIDREHLRENNTIWIMTGDRTLRIQPVDIKAQTKDKVYIDADIRPDENIITSSLTAPVNGMQLRLKTSQKQASSPETKRTSREEKDDRKRQQEEIQ